MVRHVFSLLLIPSLLLAWSSPARSSACGHVLVSGYYSTVHVYDACSGEFQRELAPRAQLAGPQALRLHQGMLYVVAENRNAIVRYRADTLAFVDEFISVAGNPGITGIAFGPDGDVYLGGYNSHSVLRFDGSTGAAKGTAVAPRSAGLAGLDNGLVFGPDGKLYIPGFTSHSIARWDPATGRTETFIAPGSGGLQRTRGILFEPGGNGILVSSEGSRQILRFHRDGRFDRVFASFSFAPNGMDFAPNGELLVTGFGGDRVERLNAANGAHLGTLVSTRSGGLSGATFLIYLDATVPAQTVDASQVGTQYWLTGAGMPEQNLLEIDLFSATGAAFGDDFDPAAIQRKRWGRLRVEFTGCDSAVMSWDSSGSDSAGFGQGGYPLQRVAATAASQRCGSAGFDPTTERDWMAGTWFGGEARSGEGLFLEMLANDVVLAAFFSFRPAGVP